MGCFCQKDKQQLGVIYKNEIMKTNTGKQPPETGRKPFSALHGGLIT